MSQPKKHPRRIKLIQPALQLRLIGEFCGLAVLGLLLQFILLGHRLGAVVSQLGPAGTELSGAIPGVLLQVLLYTFVILLPILVAFGVLFTFRIAGPVYRFEQFLGAVARGEQTAPCRLREKDALKNLCEKINVATEPLRRKARAEDDSSEAHAPEKTPQKLAG